MDRRRFLKTAAAAVPLARRGRAFALAPAGAAGSALAALPRPAADVPWQKTLRRIGQLNMTEHDPVALNIEEWADYWASLKVDAVLVSVTGIIAYYPRPKCRFIAKAKFLGDRDFFGECCAAAKKRGMHVIARTSPDLNWGDAVQAHPEWFMRDEKGSRTPHGEDPRLFPTCMFSTYMTDYVPAILREVNSLYDVDGFYTNGWPPLDHAGVSLRCVPRLPKSGTPAYWDKLNERIFYLWKLYDSSRRKRSRRASTSAIGRRRPRQHESEAGGRGVPVVSGRQSGPRRTTSPSGARRCRGGCARPCEGQDGHEHHRRMVHRPRSLAQRHNRPRSAMWMSETVASGWFPTITSWAARPGWARISLAGDRPRRSFNGPRSTTGISPTRGPLRTSPWSWASALNCSTAAEGRYHSQYMDGMYYALLEGRFLFDFVHEDAWSRRRLRKYCRRLLPNTALLSDEQCRQLRDYVNQRRLAAGHV